MAERISITRWTPPWLRQQHLARYRWASAMAPRCRVVDAACGAGYGSAMLADAQAIAVLAYDVDEATVTTASQAFGRTNLAFTRADVTSLPISDESIDLYTSFETIEHVADDRKLLAEAARILRPGGKLLCSTPNRHITNPAKLISDKPMNRYHIREYTRIELEPVLREYFSDVVWHGQTFFPSDWRRFLAQLGRHSKQTAVRVHQVRKLLAMPFENPAWHQVTRLEKDDEPEYLVAECVR